ATICSGVCFENFFMIISLPAQQGAVTEDTIKPHGLFNPAQTNPSRGGNRILEEDPATGNNRNQGKCLGTKLGALHLRDGLTTPTRSGHQGMRN
ncbi:hypothetical protein ACUY20_11865, partial [Corynebacterium segmentosum]